MYCSEMTVNLCGTKKVLDAPSRRNLLRATCANRFSIHGWRTVYVRVKEWLTLKLYIFGVTMYYLRSCCFFNLQLDSNFQAWTCSALSRASCTKQRRSISTPVKLQPLDFWVFCAEHITSQPNDGSVLHALLMKHTIEHLYRLSDARI